MNRRVCAMLGIAMSVVSATAIAGISMCGSTGGFVAAGADLTLTNAMPLVDGSMTFQDTSTHTGTIEAVRSHIHVDDGTNYASMYLTGDYNCNNGNITLNTAHDRVHMKGGKTLGAVSCTGTPVTIEGSGKLGGDITINASKTLNYKMSSPLNVDISNSGTLKLESDLVFESAKQFTMGGTINFNNHKMVLGSADLNWVEDDQTWEGASVDLSANLHFPAASVVTISTSGTINGNGHKVTFSDAEGDFGSIMLGTSTTLTLADITLATLKSESLTMGSGSSLYLKNVVISDNGGKGLINVSDTTQVTPTNGLFFGSNVTWNSRAKIEVVDDITLSAQWTFDSDAVINGNKRIINLQSGSLARVGATDEIYLSNATLTDLVTASFATAGMEFYLTDVVMVDNASAATVRVIGSTELLDTEAQVPAKMTVASGAIFNSAVTWDTGAKIELLSNITLGASATWTFSENSNLDGNGNMLDISNSATSLSIAQGKTLKLSNIVIKGWGPSSGGISFEGTGANLELSNVTILLDGDVQLGATDNITINGPVTFITGQYTFDASAGGNSNAINGLTVWYDTLGEPNTNNVTFGSDYTGGGRISAQQSAPFSRLNFADATEYLSQSEALYYATQSDANGANLNGTISGRQVVFNTASNVVTLDGEGRALILGKTPVNPASDYKLFEFTQATPTNNATLKDIFIDGFKQEHFASNDGSSASLASYKFGHKTIVRLQEDDALTSAFTVEFAADNEGVVIDLAGHELDLSHASAAIALTCTSTNNFTGTLIIRNGRITGVSGATKFTSATSSPTFLFQDVDIVLSGNTEFATAGLKFKGNCTLSGGASKAAVNFVNLSTSTVEITVGSCLTIENGVSYNVGKSGTTVANTITFGDAAATLSLVGGRLDYTYSTGSQALLGGTLRADFKSKITGPLTLGGSGSNELDIDVMPGSMIEIAGGNVVIGNPT